MTDKDRRGSKLFTRKRIVEAMKQEELQEQIASTLRRNKRQLASYEPSIPAKIDPSVKDLLEVPKGVEIYKEDLVYRTSHASVPVNTNF